ncbi:hypothetical protein [Rhizobium sp. SSA_523]|uniref:hypothetical protein n=1 Tax=Rhizobium sp. SSA_523 TaxID=2952477 RepID=UPI00209011DA|nr:hypothetical protein [Rhizobium sp. SSA_523]MCO5730086.1 hypothetical protein [Rhizobium sp. SSA_523]WKC25151.1 hypothetical protein QTJ18_14280 [Rhizobium sp. SSA_523]
MTTKTDSKADRTKVHVAAEDTIIEGRPVRKGVQVPTKDMSDEVLQSYLDAGLIAAEKAEVTKEDKVMAEAAKAIDKSEDKRTEK